MNEMGVEQFAAQNFVDVGTEMKSVVYCTDCHVQGKAELALPRPHAKDAMKKSICLLINKTKPCRGHRCVVSVM